MPPCSLLNLPTELLVEIVFHYNSFTFLSPFVGLEHNAQRAARQQTSSVLRNLFLPILWEQFEASKPNFQARRTQSEFAESVAPYIKTVHLVIKSWSRADMEEIFLLMEFLRGLPNLSGLQIQRVPLAILPSVYAFNAITLPTVTALSVPNSLEMTFSSFPNVTTLVSPELLSGDCLIPAATKNFGHLKAFPGVRLDDPHRPGPPEGLSTVLDSMLRRCDY
ncbi:hypothetical protein B0H16DRAFT_1510326 [Mycena metata]|uniref:Uncharacterized protein n=1 Tax=Mycena metata TaxID=1033252 RepID=A0AAD7JXD2_9AGAR|nr:hypothetical protein B0H16DRAFT_1510326 [Mycena metata]